MKEEIICPSCNSTDIIIHFWDENLICLNCGFDLEEKINKNDNDEKK